MEKPFMVQQVIKYSDGTETVINYVENPNRFQIEKTVAQAVAETQGETFEESTESVETGEVESEE